MSLLATSPALAQNETEQVGFSSNHLFDGGYFGENVDILNGNLNLSIPIGPRYQVTSDFSYQLSLHYNSKIWADVNTRNHRLIGESPAGTGFTLSLGRIVLATHHNDDGSITPGPTFDLYIVTPDGGRHIVVDSSGGDYDGMHSLPEDHFTNDTTYMKVRAIGDPAFLASLTNPQPVQSWKVFMPDGTTYTYGQRIICSQQPSNVC
ncbi:MAG TPA: hypothetical protein VFW45_18180 [Candidatus Polarisedimenticolia bacterium]|nr:hypothetical protein [Candidatus Polarisedimenticolia bacterium]